MSSSRPADLRHAALALACTAVACLASLPAPAFATDAMLRVEARIPRRASIAIAQPQTLQVTAEDVARGWVEAHAPVQVQVRSNIPQGYTVVFEQYGNGVREVRVFGLGSPVVLVDGRAMSSRPAPAKGYWTDEVTLRFRFALPAGAQPGEQAWPVQISLLPL